MVLETTRNGRSLGKGSNCDCNILLVDIGRGQDVVRHSRSMSEALRVSDCRHERNQWQTGLGMQTRTADWAFELSLIDEKKYKTCHPILPIQHATTRDPELSICRVFRIFRKIRMFCLRIPKINAYPLATRTCQGLALPRDRLLRPLSSPVGR